jgi:hypothetical protein
VRSWRFDEITGFSFHEEQGRRLRDSGTGISMNRDPIKSYWIEMQLSDGRPVKLFYRNYSSCFDFVEMAKRHDILEAMTGITRASRDLGI